jgi:branched-chain amino acid transport system permease protein
VGGVAFSIQDLGFVGLSLAVVLLLYAFFRLTATGLALRAAALDPDASRLLGIRVGWMLALGWGIAAALGALAGIMTAPTTQLDPNMMQGVLLYALAAAVLGGLDSPAGAVVGGLSLGVVLNLLGRYVALFGGEMRLAGGLAVILVVLLVKPAGLFGSVAARRV